MRLLSEDILKELSVEGPYIEWEWDPRTQGGDYIAMRDSSGLPVQTAHARHQRSGCPSKSARGIDRARTCLRGSDKKGVWIPALPLKRGRTETR